MSGGAPGGTQDETAAGGNARKGERIAKVIARAGICSRRDAERLVTEGRVALNGRVLTTPAVTVGPADRVEVDGNPLVTRERTRLWLFHKPRGLVTTNRDPEGRATIFSALPAGMPRVLTIGRLDINTEGLLLLTNDGGLARTLELPSTGWLRRYRVRAHGRVEQAALETLRHGATVDGMVYGAVEAEIDRVQGGNVWLLVGLREGKNREVKRVLEHLGLRVNRLIRVSYGPFQLGDLAEGEVREVRGRVLRDQLGDKLAEAAGVDFEAPIRRPEPPPEGEGPPRRRGAEVRRSAAVAKNRRPEPRQDDRRPVRRAASDKRPRHADDEPRPVRRPRGESPAPKGRHGAPALTRPDRRDDDTRPARAARSRLPHKNTADQPRPVRSRRKSGEPPNLQRSKAERPAKAGTGDESRPTRARPPGAGSPAPKPPRKPHANRRRPP